MNLFNFEETVKEPHKKKVKEVKKTITINDNKRADYCSERFFIVPTFTLHRDELYVYGRK